MKEGGQHIMDQMSLNGVEHQGVSNALVADLIAVGEIDEEEGIMKMVRTTMLMSRAVVQIRVWLTGKFR